jgi:hypothetical protein
MKTIFTIILMLFVITTVDAQKLIRKNPKVSVNFNSRPWSTEGQINTLFTTGLVTGVGTMYSFYRTTPTYPNYEPQSRTAAYIGCAITGTVITWGVVKLVRKNKSPYTGMKMTTTN